MLSKAILIGHVGKIIKHEREDSPLMITLAIVTKRKYVDSFGVKQQQISWHHVNFFSTLATVANKIVNTGDLVYIEGSISNTRVKGNDEKWAYAIMAESIKLLPKSGTIKHDYGE